MDDSYKKDMPMSARRSLPLIINKPNMKLTIDQTNVNLLSSNRFDQLVSEMDEIIRLSKEFIGLDKNIIIPIEINADTNLLISYPALLISGGLFKRIVETEINADRMDSIVYHLNNFVISYASNGGIKFWNNYINKFNMLMAAYCVESMGLTMQELSSKYYRENFTGGDYKNVFLWQYNKLMNSQSQNMSSNDMIWSFPYTMLRIKEKIGWEPFKIASNAILEQSKTNQYPYAENYNNFLNFLANNSQKNIYNMFTAKEIEKYEALLDAKLGGKYDEPVSNEILITIAEDGLSKISDEFYSLDDFNKNKITGELKGDAFDFNYVLTYAGTITSKGNINVASNWTIDNIKLFNGINTLKLYASDMDGFEYIKHIEIMVDNPNNDDMDILLEDEDNDDLSLYMEGIYGTDPKNKDTDGDGINDGDEVKNATNPLVNDSDQDPDGDKLTNLEEINNKTNPFEKDTDSDGLTDYEEVKTYTTNPLSIDTDLDTVNDFLEIQLGTNPLVKDEQTVVNYTKTNYEDEDIVPEISVESESKNINSISIEKVSKENIFLSDEIPGSIGDAFSFKVDQENCNAKITLKVKKEIVDNIEASGSSVKAFYLDKETNSLKEVENQTLVKKVSRDIDGSEFYYIYFDYLISYNVHLILLNFELFFNPFIIMKQLLANAYNMPAAGDGTVLILDQSYLMSRYVNKTAVKPLAKETIDYFLTKQPDSKFAIMDYCLAQPLWWSPMINNKTSLLRTIDTAVDGTYGWDTDLPSTLLKAQEVFPFPKIKSSSFESNTLDIKNDSLDTLLQSLDSLPNIETLQQNDLELESTTKTKEEYAAILEKRLQLANDSLSENADSLNEFSFEPKSEEFASIQPASLNDNNRKHIILITQGDTDYYYDTDLKYNTIINSALSKGVKIHVIQISDSETSHMTKITSQTGGVYLKAPIFDEVLIKGLVINLYNQIYGNSEIDYNLDSDQDGLPDYYEQKINEDVIVFGLNNKPLSKFSRDKGINQLSMFDADTDMDGLKDGEEIILEFDENAPPDDKYNPKYFKEANIISSPLKKDTDYDGIKDALELLGKTGTDSNQEKSTFYHEKLESDPYEYYLSYNVDYSKFFKENTIYHKELSKFSSILATLAYYKSDNLDEDYPSPKNYGNYMIKPKDKDEKLKLMDFMKFHGFENVQEFNIDNIDEHIIQYNIGSQIISNKDKNKLLISIPIRGTYGTTEEWSSNVEFGGDNDPTNSDEWLDKENHKGFDIVANRIILQIEAYTNEAKQNNSDAEVVYWLTGHSRGAAVANLVAKKLIDKGNETFAYTFATPRTTVSDSAGNYTSIFNIVNNEDFVPKFPFYDENKIDKWNFKRYGVDLVQEGLTDAQRFMFTDRVNINYSANKKLVNSILFGLGNFSVGRDESYEFQNKLDFTVDYPTDKKEAAWAVFKLVTLQFMPKYSHPYQKQELASTEIKYLGKFVQKQMPMFLLQLIPDLITKNDTGDLNLPYIIKTLSYISKRAYLELIPILVISLFNGEYEEDMNITDSVAHPHFPDSYIILSQTENFDGQIETSIVDEYEQDNPSEELEELEELEEEINAEAYNGKLAYFTNETKILTTTGYKPVNELYEEIFVKAKSFDRFGVLKYKQYRVTKPENASISNVYKIETDKLVLDVIDGTSLCVKDDNNNYIWVSAKLINEGDVIRIGDNDEQNPKYEDATVSKVSVENVNLAAYFNVKGATPGAGPLEKFYVEYFVKGDDVKTEYADYGFVTSRFQGFNEQEINALSQYYSDEKIIRYINNSYINIYRNIPSKMFIKESFTPAAAVTINKTTGENLSYGYNKKTYKIEDYPKQFEINFETEIDKATNETLKANLKAVQEMKRRSDFINENFKNPNGKVIVNPITNKPYVDETLDKINSDALAGGHAEVHSVAEALIPEKFLDSKGNLTATDNLISKDNLITFVIRTEDKTKAKVDFGKPFHTCAHCSFILDGFETPANYINAAKNENYEDALKEYNDLYDEKLKNITGNLTNIYDNVVYRDYIFGVAS